MLDDVLQNMGRVGLLAVPALLGWLTLRLRLLADAKAAGAGLNAFALYFAFPALVIDGIVGGSFELPSGVGFWLVVPLCQGALALAAYPLSRALGRAGEAGTLALIGLFGNIGYLGLPYVIATFGAQLAGVGALIVSMHVAMSVTFGPIVLARWSGSKVERSWTSVLAQPLVWAPFIGAALRALPTPATEAAHAIVAPLSAAAAPVALFLLGLQLAAPRESAAWRNAGVWWHSLYRLCAAPALTAAVCLAFVAANWLDAATAPLFVIFAAMPAAVTTLIIANDVGVGEDRVAGTIVVSTLVGLATLPVITALAVRAFV